jgi:hypothetical protein
LTRLVHVIADYGPGDLAFAELMQRLGLVLPDPRWGARLPAPPGSRVVVRVGEVSAPAIVADANGAVAAASSCWRRSRQAGARGRARSGRAWSSLALRP